MKRIAIVAVLMLSMATAALGQVVLSSALTYTLCR